MPVKVSGTGRRQLGEKGDRGFCHMSLVDQEVADAPVLQEGDRRTEADHRKGHREGERNRKKYPL